MNLLRKRHALRLRQVVVATYACAPNCVPHHAGIVTVTIVELTFWASVAAIVYSLIVYPMAIKVMAMRSSSAVSADTHLTAELPRFSIIIPADREERSILDRISQALGSDYPHWLFEVLVAAPAHENLTPDLVRTVSSRRVRLIEFTEWPGLPSVLNQCIDEATGEIMLVVPADHELRSDALQRMAAQFRRAGTGGVWGHVESQRNAKLLSEIRSWIRRCEGRAGLLIDGGDSLLAFRKSLYKPLAEHAARPFTQIAGRICRRERIGYEPAAIATQHNRATHASSKSLEPSKLVEGWQRGCALISCRAWESLAGWSKLCQLLTPLFLFVALASNIALAGNTAYLCVLLVQEVLYLGAIVSLVMRQSRAWRSPLCTVEPD